MRNGRQLVSRPMSEMPHKKKSSCVQLFKHRDGKCGPIDTDALWRRQSNRDFLVFVLRCKVTIAQESNSLSRTPTEQ